jgi:P-type Cu2+ transporter
MAEVILHKDEIVADNLAPAGGKTSSVDPAAFVQKNETGEFLELAIFGARCAGCIAKIEGGVKSLPGIKEVRLNLSSGKLYVAWQGDLRPSRITEKIAALGYRAVPFDPEAGEREQDQYGRKLLKSMAIAGFAMANIMLLSVGVWASGEGEMGTATRGLMHWVSAIIAIPAVAYAGQPFFSSALRALKAGSANMDVPISLAVILAVVFSLFETFNHGPHAYFDAAVMLLFFLLIGRWLDHNLRNRARSAAKDLIALQSISANLLQPDGNVVAVQAKELAPGDRVLLMPGDRVPVDSVIVEGRSDMDLSLLNGESAPALKQEGDLLHSGIVNISHKLVIEAKARLQESFVAELARLVEAGQQSKSKFVRLADKAAKLYVPVVHTLAAITFLGWYFILDGGLRIALMNAIAVLIITCPCAMGLATPAVQSVATGRLFKRGILVKSGDALERLAKITMVAFDKTGTLTLGKMRWLNENEFSDTEKEILVQLARASRHPIAKAIIASRGGAGPIADDAKEIAGMGILGVVDGQKVRLGRADFVDAENLNTGEDYSVSWLRIENQKPKALKFEDILRPDVRKVMDDLKRQGLKVMLLSGDREQAVKSVAGAAGIDIWYAGMTPEEKITRIEEARQQGEIVALVGDGLNDTPALAHAHVALSPGSAAEAAQSAADFVFQGQSLMPVIETWRIARQSRGRILENFSFSAFYNFIAAPLAMAGFVTPLIAALAMSGSSLIVILNALRIKTR